MCCVGRLIDNSSFGFSLDVVAPPWDTLDDDGEEEDMDSFVSGFTGAK